MKAFISYAHRDEAALDRLHVHLKPLLRQNLLKAWFDREILAGDVIDEEIRKELQSAHLFLLLITPDFIASDYCMEDEMKTALQRHKACEARVVPIIVEPCSWELIDELRCLKAIPKDGKPISQWQNPNEAYVDVVKELERIISKKEGFRPRSHLSENKTSTVQSAVSRYHIQRNFTQIDHDEFRDRAFLVIKDHFQQKVDEINSIDGLRGRFVEKDDVSFGSTVINCNCQHGIAHITVHCRSRLGGITVSFRENAPNTTVNQMLDVSSNAHEQFLVVSRGFSINDPGPMTPEKTAEYLWEQFIQQARITPLPE